MGGSRFHARLRVAVGAIAVATGTSFAASALGVQPKAEQLRRTIAQMEARGDQDAADYYRRMLAEFPEEPAPTTPTTAPATEALRPRPAGLDDLPVWYRKWLCIESAAYAKWEAKREASRVFSPTTGTYSYAPVSPPPAPHVELKQPYSLPGRGEVFIRMPNIRRDSWTRTQGLEVRWDWNDLDDSQPGYRFSFVIEPSGEGKYFDFDYGEEQEDGTVSAKPRQRYTCRVEDQGR